MVRFKKKNILIDVRTYFVDIFQYLFFIQPILPKGLHKYSLEILELLSDVKMENGFFGKIQKDTRHKMGTHFKTQL